jgi:hypothetical protein
VFCVPKKLLIERASSLKILMMNTLKISSVKDKVRTSQSLVIEGRYIELYIQEGVYAELRIASANRNRLVKDI